MKPRALALVIAMAVLLATAPVSAAPRDRVSLKTKSAATITAGSTAWIVLMWKAPDVSVSDFEVTVPSPPAGVTIEYPMVSDPPHGRSFTSLYYDDLLGPGEMDYTAIRLAVPYGAKKFTLNVHTSYVVDGNVVTETKKVKVPVVRYKGADIEQSTTDAGTLGAGSADWIGVTYTGMAPSLTGFRLTVTDPAGLGISYPSEQSMTSLHQDAELDWGETDVARFYVDTTGASPGTYLLGISATYEKGPEMFPVPGTLTLTVAAP